MSVISGGLQFLLTSRLVIVTRGMTRGEMLWLSFTAILVLLLLRSLQEMDCQEHLLCIPMPLLLFHMRTRIYLKISWHRLLMYVTAIWRWSAVLIINSLQGAVNI